MYISSQQQCSNAHYKRIRPVIAGKATAWSNPRIILTTRARYTEDLAARGNSKVIPPPPNIANPNANLKTMILSRILYLLKMNFYLNPILVETQAAGIIAAVYPQ